MRRSRSEAAVVRSYAESKGLALRTAQLHAKVGHPEWMVFVRGKAATAEEAAQAVEDVNRKFAEMVGTAGDGKGPLEKSRTIEAESYKTLIAIMELKRVAIVKNSPDLAAICKAEIEAQASHRRAADALERAEVAAGNLIPAGDVAELRKKFISPLRQLLMNMPAEIAGRVPAFDQAEVIRQCELWLRDRLLPQLEAAGKAMEQYDAT